MTRMRAVVVPAVLAAALALACAGCGGQAPAAPPQRPASPQARPAPAGTPTAIPHRKHKRPQVFTAKVSRIQHRSQVRYSWHPGCPVAPSGLRLITMTYRGFDHRVHTGRLVVNAAVTGKLI
ncbi:MAG: M15 family peptidase, partial [Actinomycetota bacterium]